jgi:hypothetical protein
MPFKPSLIFEVRPGAYHRKEYLKGATLGQASALLTNIRLGKKCLPWTMFWLIWPLRDLSVTAKKCYKTFKEVIYKYLYWTIVFVPGRPFSPSLMFASKARAYPSEATFRCFTPHSPFSSLLLSPLFSHSLSYLLIQSWSIILVIPTNIRLGWKYFRRQTL